MSNGGPCIDRRGFVRTAAAMLGALVVPDDARSPALGPNTVIRSEWP